MKMQNLDFTMIHIHGRKNVTDNMPRDARERKDWSRETRESSDSSQADHAVVLETEQNAELQQLKPNKTRSYSILIKHRVFGTRKTQS